MRCVVKPDLLISAPDALFRSFFTSSHQRRLARAFQWTRISGSALTPALRRGLADAQAMITTWDSPRFGDELLGIAPKLRVIAHCGGEVKSRFQASLLDTLTITTAPEPMARATAELAATLLLYCGRNVDFYRGRLHKPSNRIYDEVHANGTPESLIGGVPLSVTRTVTVLVLGPCASVGNQLSTPVVGSMLRPRGAPAARCQVNGWAGISASRACNARVKITRSGIV